MSSAGDLSGLSVKAFVAKHSAFSKHHNDELKLRYKLAGFK